MALNPKAVNQPEWAAAGKGAEPSDVAEGEPTYMIVEAHELLARVGEFSRRYMHSLGDKFETLDKEVAPVGSVHPRVRDRLLSVYIGM